VRPLLHNCNLPIRCWGHVVLHAVDLIQLRPTAYHNTSRLYLVRGNDTSISHLRKFECVVYAPISPPKCTSMGPHRKLGIYMGYHSPSIIKYMEPLTGDLFTAWYADCIFNEDHFPALGEDYKYHSECQEINWDDKSILSSDPHTKETELQVQKIINLQNVANNLPDAFTDYKGVTKSWNPMVNAPERVEVSKKTTQAPSVVKRGRVAQTKKDNTPNKRLRKEKTRPLQKAVNVSQPMVDRHHMDIPQSSTQVRYRKESASMSENPDALVLGNHKASTRIQEIFINYTSFREVYDRNTTIVSPCFSTVNAENFLADPDPKIMAECKGRSDWNKWKEATEAELNSLKKRKVFTKVIHTPPRIFPVGFKWVFI
jgi:hypothetical protein